MENNPKSTHPKAIGILDILSGVIFIAGGLVCLHQSNIDYYDQVFVNWAIVLFVAAAFVISAGVVAIKRGKWRYILVGSCVAMLAFLGIPAFILSLKSKSEFNSFGDLPIRKTSIAGILMIIGGLAIGWFGILASLIPLLATSMYESGHYSNTTTLLFFLIMVLGIGLALALAIFIVIGGVMAIRRRRWKLARVACIIACFVLVGIPALIWINESKEEFQGNK